jgi:hypothetical protein
MKRHSMHKPNTASLKKFVLGHMVSLGLGVVFAVLIYQGPRLLHSNSFFSRAGKIASKKENKPWGVMEVTPMELDRPEEFYKQSSDEQPRQQIEWLFENYTPAQLAEFIESCELSTAEKGVLLDRNRWRVGRNGVLVTPPLELVRDLKSSARKRLYSALAKSSLNVAQHYPLVFDPAAFERLLADSSLAAAQLELVRKLTYTQDGFVYFCDGQAFELLSTRDQGRALMQDLTRVPTLMVKLQVDRDSDIDALVRYWANDERAPGVRRFLTAAARTPGALSISHLFPPVPRIRLYNYPAVPKDDKAAKPDCFWTAMNFFSEQPDDRFYDENFRAEVLKTRYEPVPEASAFGDILYLYRESNGQKRSVHMCNYIADNIVFTKNGTNYFSPWVLMTMPEMISQYASDQPLQMAVFRPKRTR